MFPAVVKLFFGLYPEPCATRVELCAAKRLGVARGASIIPAHGNAQAALLARRVVFKTKGQSEAGATSHCRCPYPDAYWSNASSRYM